MNPLQILSGGAANGLVNALSANFKQTSGLDIVGDYGAVGAMFDRVVAGEPVDIVILSQKLMDDLCQRGLVSAPSLRPLGRVVTGVCVRADMATPTINDAASLKAALLAADAIYLPDYVKATAGIHFAGVLKQLGIFETLAPRLKTYPNGQTAMTAMAKAHDQHPIGCTQITEILNTPGVRYVADLPKGLDLATVYTAGLASASRQAQAVEALIALLCAPEHAATRIKAGFSA